MQQQNKGVDAVQGRLWGYIVGGSGYVVGGSGYFWCCKERVGAARGYEHGGPWARSVVNKPRNSAFFGGLGWRTRCHKKQEAPEPPKKVRRIASTSNSNRPS